MQKEGFGKLTSIVDTKLIISRLKCKINDEIVNLDKALNRILAEDVSSEINVPSFDKTIMDGYALKASDTNGATNTNPAIFKQIGAIYPGDIKDLRSDICPDSKLGDLSLQKTSNPKCMEIATGAAVPAWADAIAKVEITEKNGDEISVYQPVAPGNHIVKAGYDIAKNEEILHKGQLLTPLETALLSNIGKTKILVKRKPIVAVCSTGKELVKPPEQLKPGQIYDSNSRAIIDMLENLNCQPVDLGIAQDDKKVLRDKISKGTEKADILIFTGSSSMGATDFLIEVIQELGDLLVHGVAIKPGKPTSVSTVNSKTIFGLPGHPAAAINTFKVFVEPFIYQVLGLEQPAKKIIKAKLSRKVVSMLGRHEFMSVKLRKNNDEFTADPILKGSSALTAVARADGIFEIDAFCEVLESGETVKIQLT